MNKAAGMNHHRPALKLVLCLIGIVLVIAILIAMRPLPGNKNSDAAASKPAPAKHLGNSGISAVAQASPAVQAAASGPSAAGLAVSDNPQAGQTDYSSGASSSSAPVSVPPSQPPPPADPDILIYPIDPAPCKKLGGVQPYCHVCEPYPGPAGQTGSCPRCYGGGIEMACAYPL